MPSELTSTVQREKVKTVTIVSLTKRLPLKRMGMRITSPAMTAMSIRESATHQ